MNKKAAFVFTIALCFSVCRSGADSGTTSAAFLKLGQGNRATAMGGSFAASVRGPAAVFWNPAGLATGIFNEAQLIYNNWVHDIYWGYASYRHNLGDGGFGAAVTYLDSGDITRRGAGREESGSPYSLTDIAVDIGQGLRLTDNINGGVVLKFINENIDDESATAVAVGFGGQYHRKLNRHYLSAGFSCMNLGTRMGYSDKFPLPAVIRLDAANVFPGQRMMAHAGVDYLIIEERATAGAGIEFGAAPFLDLRCGYRFGYRDVNAIYGLTAGFGIKYIEEVEYSFDYSFATLGDLGYINRIGFGVRF